MAPCDLRSSRPHRELSFESLRHSLKLRSLTSTESYPISTSLDVRFHLGGAKRFGSTVRAARHDDNPIFDQRIGRIGCVEIAATDRTEGPDDRAICIDSAVVIVGHNAGVAEESKLLSIRLSRQLKL